MNKTKIEWTDRTWNPFRGCTRVSEGCRNCYAERMAARFAKDESAPYFGISRFVDTQHGKEARWTGEVRIIEKLMDAPLRWKKPSLIFLNSMSDTFHESVPDAAIIELFDVMGAATQHHFQVLTKRPERMLEMQGSGKLRYGYPNIWMGVSIEDVKTVDRCRIFHELGARVQWVSAEPLLEDITEAIAKYLPYIDWLVCGGESGHAARPMDAKWAYNLYLECSLHNTRYFFKQMGGRKGKGANVLRSPYQQEGAPIQNEYPFGWKF